MLSIFLCSISFNLENKLGIGFLYPCYMGRETGLEDSRDHILTEGGVETCRCLTTELKLLTTILHCLSVR